MIIVVEWINPTGKSKEMLIAAKYWQYVIYCPYCVIYIGYDHKIAKKAYVSRFSYDHWSMTAIGESTTFGWKRIK